jgi:hypothetical protein
MQPTTIKELKKMKIIIDRFEGKFAVVELPNGKMIDMPKELVPPQAKEGAILEIIYNAVETNNRDTEIRNKMNKLFND